jgi:hypothetical protein
VFHGVKVKKQNRYERIFLTLLMLMTLNGELTPA